MKKTFGVLAVILAIFGFSYLNTSCSTTAKVDYSTQVKPILNKKCISCHGGVKKQGGWSLLFEEEALAKTKSGVYAMFLDDAGASDMIRRLTLDDPEERMPYESEPLTQEEIDILTRWINEGAKWGEHWAYQEVQPTEVPQENVENPVDAFIIEKAAEKELTLSPQADPETLVRRLGLDIVGFPVVDSLSKTFINNPIEENYEATS